MPSQGKNISRIRRGCQAKWKRTPHSRRFSNKIRGIPKCHQCIQRNTLCYLIWSRTFSLMCNSLWCIALSMFTISLFHRYTVSTFHQIFILSYSWLFRETISIGSEVPSHWGRFFISLWKMKCLRIIIWLKCLHGMCKIFSSLKSSQDSSNKFEQRGMAQKDNNLMNTIFLHFYLIQWWVSKAREGSTPYPV